MLGNKRPKPIVPSAPGILSDRRPAKQTLYDPLRCGVLSSDDRYWICVTIIGQLRQKGKSGKMREKRMNPVFRGLTAIFEPSFLKTALIRSALRLSTGFLLLALSSAGTPRTCRLPIVPPRQSAAMKQQNRILMFRSIFSYYHGVSTSTDSDLAKSIHVSEHAPKTFIHPNSI